MLIMDKPQNTTVNIIRSKAKWRSFFPSFIPSVIARADPIMLTIVEFLV